MSNSESLNPPADIAEIEQRWPGALDGDTEAMTRFIFHAQGHFPQALSTDLRERWHDTNNKERFVDDVLEDITRHTAGHSEPELSRFDFAVDYAEKVRFDAVTEALAGKLEEEGNIQDKLSLVREYLAEWGFVKGRNYESSPMFPHGRWQFDPIEYDEKGTAKHAHYGTKLVRPVSDDVEHLHGGIEQFLLADAPRHFQKERISAAIEALAPLNEAELNRLRSQYGAKAANLVVFTRFMSGINAITRLRFEMPKFLPVSVDLYDAWQSGGVEYSEMLEAERQAAIQLIPDRDDEMTSFYEENLSLVAVRSSAVLSEDNEASSAAGIYESTIADPKDPEAFRQAVEKVFASVNSRAAVAYREARGIKDPEKMGLVIQQYWEGTGTYSASWGYMDSRGNHPNVITASSKHGQLLFDRSYYEDNLLLRTDLIDNKKANLHDVPDHNTELSREALRP